MTTDIRLPTLQDKLDYRFRDEQLLVRALTHRSASRQHNERLEFLGDAVLGYVIGEYLHRTRQSQREDSLSLLRASLIKKDSLVELARAIALGEHLSLGRGKAVPALPARFHSRRCVGSGHRGGARRRWCRSGPHPDHAPVPAAAENLGEWVAKDAKTDLQERVQAQGLGLPAYRIVDVEGRHHEQVFNVVCEVEDMGVSVAASGPSKKAAEQSAAARMIGEIEARDR